MISKQRTKLAKARLITGLTQPEFARALGISMIHLVKIEAGDRPLSQRLASAIEYHTGISAEWLTTTDDEEPQSATGKPFTLEIFAERRARIKADMDAENYRTLVTHRKETAGEILRELEEVERETTDRRARLVGDRATLLWLAANETGKSAIVQWEIERALISIARRHQIPFNLDEQ